MPISFTFTYKREEYVVHKTSIGLETITKRLIVYLDICLEEDMYSIEMDVYDEDYIDV